MQASWVVLSLFFFFFCSGSTVALLLAKTRIALLSRSSAGNKNAIGGIEASRHSSRLFAKPTGGSKAADNATRGPRPMKVKDDVIQVSGKVVESLPNAMFRVEVGPTKQVVLATVSGKIRKNMVRIIVGDSVQLELSAYDLTRGRIYYRNR